MSVTSATTRKSTSSLTMDSALEESHMTKRTSRARRRMLTSASLRENRTVFWCFLMSALSPLSATVTRARRVIVSSPRYLQDTGRRGEG